MLKVCDINRYDLLNNPGSDGPCMIIWFAGCSVHCPECHNPKMWDHRRGRRYTVDQLTSAVIRNCARYCIQDIVLLGGEPLEQDIGELSEMCKILNDRGFRMWLYTSKDITQVPKDIRNSCYFIKCGKYDRTRKTDKFPASDNQKVYMRSGQNLTLREVIL